MEPRVSVLMTAYNRERFLNDAIESVLRSSFTDFELIVVDDASTDSSVEIARKFEQLDGRVHVIVNSTNLGDYRNRNRAASEARGIYLKYLDSDDTIYPHGLAVMVECMEQFPTAGLGLSAAPEGIGAHPRHLTPRDAYRKHYLGENILGRAPGSAIIRREIFEAIGGFSGLRQVGDHELWLRIARRTSIVTMPRDLVWSREHGDQEQFYDGEVERAIMHEEVLLTALDASNCPLTEPEIAAARVRLARNRVSNYLRLLKKQGGLHLAREYKRRVDLRTGMVARSLLSRLRAIT
jgi:glycosyltransferase involved in cell wall biosynthesis